MYNEGDMSFEGSCDGNMGGAGVMESVGMGMDTSYDEYDNAGFKPRAFTYSQSTDDTSEGTPTKRLILSQDSTNSQLNIEVSHDMMAPSLSTFSKVNFFDEVTREGTNGLNLSNLRQSAYGSPSSTRTPSPRGNLTSFFDFNSNARNQPPPSAMKSKTKKRSPDRKTWLQSKGDMAIV